MIFNFKGSEDLAICNGHEGPYGGPPYDMYVFHKTKNKFVSSEDLSALTYENLDMFEVDSKRKRMITHAKEGVLLLWNGRISSRS